MLRWFASRAPMGQFARQAMTVMLGTIAAQLIAIAASPILARLYAPADFGLFALYLSCVTIAGSLATARYDVAVMMPSTDSESDHLAIGAMTICAASSFVLLVAMLLLSPALAQMLGAPSLAPWLKIAPAAVFLTGICSTFSFWCNRQARYRTLTASRITQAAANSSTAIGLGLVWSTGGMFVSALIGQLLCAILLVRAVRSRYVGLERPLRAHVAAALRRYKKYPAMSIPTDLISQLSAQLPRFVIGIYFGSTALGLFFLNQRVLDLPLGVVAGSVREVFSQRANKQYLTEGACNELFLKTFRLLLFIALLPSALVFVTAPDAFALVFGERWREAGVYTQIMVPMYFFRFAISPLCMMFYIAQKQQQELLWQAVLLLLTCASFAVGVAHGDAKVGLACYSATYSTMYLIIFFMALRLARSGSRASSRGPISNR